MPTDAQPPRRSSPRIPEWLNSLTVIDPISAVNADPLHGLWGSNVSPTSRVHVRHQTLSSTLVSTSTNSTRSSEGRGLGFSTVVPLRTSPVSSDSRSTSKRYTTPLFKPRGNGSPASRHNKPPASHSTLSSSPQLETFGTPRLRAANAFDIASGSRASPYTTDSHTFSNGRSESVGSSGLLQWQVLLQETEATAEATHCRKAVLQGSTPASSPEAAAQCFQAQAEAAATWLQRQQQLDIFGAVSSPVSDSQSATSLNAAGTSASSAGTLQKLQASTHAISSIAAAASKQMLQSDPDPTCAQSNKLESIAPTAAAIPDVNAPSEAVAQGCMVTPPALQQSQSSADSGAREPSLLQPDSNSQEVPVDRHYLLVTCTSPMQQAQQQAELQEVASCMSLATVDSASLATTQQANQPPEQLREQNQLEAQLLAIQASSTENDMLRSTQANAAAGQSAEQCTPCGREQMAGKGASPALKQFALTVQQHQPQAEQPRQPQAEQQHQPQTEQRHQSQAEPQHEPQAEQQPQVQQHQQLRDKPIEQQVQAKAEPQVEQQPHWTEEQQQTHGEAQQQQSPQAQQQQQQLNEVQTEEKLQVQAEAEAEQQKQPQTELEGKQQLEPETEPCSEEQQQQPQAEPCAEQQHQPQSEQQQQPQVQQQQQPWDEPQAELRQQPQDERSQQPQAEQQQHPQAQQQHQPQAELQAEQFQPESESAAEQQKQPQVKLTAEQQLKLQTEPCIEQQQQPQAELEQQEPQAQRQHQSQPEQSEQSPAQQQQHAQTEAQAEQHQLLQAEQKPQVQQQQQPSANSLEQLEQSLAEQQPQVQTEQQQLHGEQQQRPKAELQAEQQQAPQVEQQQQAQAELKAKEHLQPKSEPEAEQPKQPWVKLTAEQQLEQNAEPGIEQHQEPQTQQQQRSQADLQAEQQEQPQAEQQQQPQAEQEHTHFANPAQLPSVNQLAPPEVATCEASAISLGESLSKPHLEPEHESRKTHCSGAASNSHQQDCSAEGRVVNESAATCNSTSSAASRVSGDNSIGIYSRSHSSSFQDRSAAAVPSSQWPSPIESILVQQPSIQKRTNSTSDSADQGCLQQPFTDTCSNSPLVSAAQICLQQHSVDASANIPSDTAVNTSSLHSSTVGDRSGFADLRSESSAALAAVGVSSLQPNAADEMTSPANACSERLSDSATECNSTRRYGTTVATCADCVIASAANENVSSLQSCAENDMGSCADVQSMSRQNCAVEASSCISAAGQHSAAVNTHNVVEQPCNGQLPDEQAQLPDIPSAVVPCQHTSFQEPQVCQTATQQECSDQQLTTQHGRVQLNQCAAGSPMVPSSQCRGEAVQQTLHTVQGMCDHHDSMQQGQADAGCNKHQQTRAATPASHDVRSAAADARHMPADSLRSSEQSAIAHAQHMFVPSFHGSEQPAATTTQHIFPGQFQEPKQSAEAVVDAACKQRQRGLSDPHVHLSQNNRMGRATSTVTPQYLAAKDSGQDAPYGFQIAVGDSDLPYRSNAGIHRARATLVSQYTSALEAIQEQPKHQPYRSSDTPAIAPFRADLQFFLGSHPELTPRYAEGVILMQQAANPGLDTACPLRSDQLTFRHGDQCAKQQHARVASQQFPESCGMLRPASMRHAVDPVSKSLCSREQQLLHVSESSCLPARLASFGYSHRAALPGLDRLNSFWAKQADFLSGLL